MDLALVGEMVVTPLVVCRANVDVNGGKIATVSVNVLPGLGRGRRFEVTW